MRQIAGTRIAQTILGGILLAGILGAGDQVSGQESGSITEDELGLHRPANMFKLLENEDSAVCMPLLASLNTEAPRRQMPLLFPLLKNKFIVDVWHEQEYHYRSKLTSERKTGSFEAAILDFDGDDSPDGLFRDRSSIQGNEFNNVWFARSVPDRVVKGQILDQQTVMELRNEKNNFPKLGHWEHYVEVVRMAGKLYVIAADAGYWSLEDRPRLPDVQLVQLAGDRWKRVCMFKSLIKIMRRY